VLILAKENAGGGMAFLIIVQCTPGLACRFQKPIQYVTNMPRRNCFRKFASSLAQNLPRTKRIVYRETNSSRDAGIAQLVEQLICNSRKRFCACFHCVANRCER